VQIDDVRVEGVAGRFLKRDVHQTHLDSVRQPVAEKNGRDKDYRRCEMCITHTSGRMNQIKVDYDCTLWVELSNRHTFLGSRGLAFRTAHDPARRRGWLVT
jgi:hypothetical protein